MGWLNLFPYNLEIRKFVLEYFPSVFSEKCRLIGNWVLSVCLHNTSTNMHLATYPYKKVSEGFHLAIVSIFAVHLFNRTLSKHKVALQSELK